MQRYRKVLAFILVIMFVVVGAGCQKKEEVVATVNSAQITQGDLDQMVRLVQLTYGQQVNAEEDALKDNVLNQLIDQEILLQEAEKNNLKTDKEEIKGDYEDFRNYLTTQVYPSEDEFKAALKKYDLTEEILKDFMVKQKSISKLYQEVTKDVTVDEDEIKAYFDAHKDQFNEPEMVRARHILVKTEEEAVDIRKELEQGGEFESLAKKYSTEPGADQSGGELGFFPRGRMVPEFEEAAFSLSVGEISQPVKTQFGYHLIKVEEKNAAKEATYADVDKETLKAMVLEQKKQEIFNEAFQDLKNNAKVEKSS